MKQPISDSAQSRLADELGISRATVSKTIRHCSGVDSRMRLKVLRAAKDADLLSPQGSCDIYCIIPDTPHFFWGEMRRGICDVISTLPHPLRIKFNVISSLHDTEVIELYLDEAAAMHAKVLVLAIAATDAIRARLTEYASQSGTMVLLLSEYHSIVNSFYIGSDAYHDGSRMAEICAAHFPDHQPAILTVDSNENADARTRGFLDRWDRCTANIIRIPPDYLTDPNLRSSRIARLLTELPETSSVLYVTFGIPGLVRAIEKRRTADSPVCLCHDKAPTECADFIAAVCIQDVYGQGRDAIRAAYQYLTCAQYPIQKRTILSSTIIDEQIPKEKKGSAI